MKMKIIEIIVCTLVVFATIIPVATASNINKINTEKSNTSQTILQYIEPQAITSLFPKSDSKIDKSMPDTIYGADDTLWVTDYPDPWIERSFLQFDLSSIPVGTTINGAKLYLYFWEWCDAGDYEIGIYRVINPWTELGITWNDRKSGTPWANPGGDYDPTLIDSVILGEAIPPSYVSWDLTTLVRSWVDGIVPNYGLMLKCVSETGGIPMKLKIFRSKEYSNPAEYPYLEVDYVKSRNREINTPFLQFLKDYLYPYPILSLLLQRLGLQ